MNKARITLLITSLNWCVLGRGIHEHFGLLQLNKALKFKNSYNDQRTKCFCKQCDNELCGSNSHKCSVITERGAYEIYNCSKCKTENIYEFGNYPVPVLVDKLH